MPIPEGEFTKTILGLVTTGALIGVGKLLVSSEKITFRVVLGRAILGSATSLLAGIILWQIPNIHPLALLGIGSGLGIIGQQYIEKLLRQKAGELMKAKEGKDSI